MLFVQALFLRLVRRAWFSSQASAMSFAVLVYLAAALFFYRLLIVNNYDEKMYDKYNPSGTDDPTKQKGLLLAVFLTAVPYLLLAALKLLFPKDH